MRRFRSTAGPTAGAVLLAGMACYDAVAPNAGVAELTIEPDSLVLEVGSSAQLTATARDSAGQPLEGAFVWVSWSSADTTVAQTVAPIGTVSARSRGRTWIRASAGVARDSVALRVAGHPQSLTLAPDTIVLGLRAVAQVGATLRDSAGDSVPVNGITWSTDDATVASVSPTTGVLTAIGAGRTAVWASAGGLVDTAMVDVLPLDTIRLIPAAATIVVDGVLEFRAVALDPAGDTLGALPITWTSSDTSVATVSDSGLVTGRTIGATAIEAHSAGKTTTVGLHVRTVTFTSFDIGEFDNPCGVSTDSLAFCTGGGFDLGIGERTVISPMPLLVTDTLRFRLVSVGEGFACTLGPSGAAYCWGYAAQGRLGDGRLANSYSPVAVVGGLSFDTISSGHSTTCALTANGAAYCWGGNSQGELGYGPGSSLSTMPVAVSGGLTFLSISAGQYATCGIAVDSTAYCWGGNDYGQLGTGDTTKRYVPTAVAGGLTFKSLSISFLHACGVAVDGTAYCWGGNESGELGVGDTLPRYLPAPVAGGLSFKAIATGGNHGDYGFTCGLTTDDVAYCWGSNFYDQLGAPATATCHGLGCSPAPQAVSGGLTFRWISAGEGAVCGMATSGLAYCWGRYALGVPSGSVVPTRVIGQP